MLYVIILNKYSFSWLILYYFKRKPSKLYKLQIPQNLIWTLPDKDQVSLGVQPIPTHIASSWSWDVFDNRHHHILCGSYTLGKHYLLYKIVFLWFQSCPPSVFSVESILSLGSNIFFTTSFIHSYNCESGEQRMCGLKPSSKHLRWPKWQGQI